MPSWQRIAHTTIKKYFRREEINILRNRKLLALLQDRGRITYNHSGESMDWKVRFRRAPVSGYADGDTLTFARVNRHQTASLPWRGYTVTDSMTKMEEHQNKNAEAIIKFTTQMTKYLRDDIDDGFGDMFYDDGEVSTKGIHGLESMFGTNGTVNISTGAERSANAADRVGSPEDTYAGLETDLGNYGGSWTGSWPSGSGDAHYDFWSPLIVATDSEDYGTTNDNWADQGDQVVRYAIIQTQKNKSKRGMLDLILVDRTMYEQFLALIDSKERFNARPGRQEGSLAKLGFTDSVNYDGVSISYEYGIPADTGYGINVDCMELRSLQSQLFMPDDDMDLASRSKRFVVDFLGNLVMNPREFCKFAILT